MESSEQSYPQAYRSPYDGGDSDFYGSGSHQRILYVRLPCNPIFPIGVVYLSDHVHKVFPEIEQRIFDLGAVPPLDFNRALEQCVDEFQPTKLVFSWRNKIQTHFAKGCHPGHQPVHKFEYLAMRRLKG